MTQVADQTPVLVGVGQYCPAQFDPAAPESPYDLMAKAARSALEDSGAGAALAESIDHLVVMKLFVDMGFMKAPFGKSTKAARSVAQRLGLQPAQVIYSSVGGNVPQATLNGYAERIARGEVRAVLVAGGEALRTTAAAGRAGQMLNWAEDPAGDMADLGGGDDMVADFEFAHGIGMATWTYPLFEHAIRGRRGRDVVSHQAALGRLFAGFNAVAQRNPRAAFGQPMTAEAIATPGPDNRIIGHPYTRWMNASDRVDQAAAVVLTSAGEARRLGIPEARWVYLRGGGDTHAKATTLEQPDLGESPAMRVAAREALAQAGLKAADMAFFDLYSCFPSAVELACDALGLSEDDPRDLTVTGGLPFFGGPGQACVLHAVAETVERLRRGHQTGERHALVSGNGGLVHKHSFGVYSLEPGTAPWQRVDPAVYQAELDAQPSPRVERAPQGAARIETYTVLFEKGEPVRGVIVGRLDADNARFVANTPADRPDLLQWLLTAEPLGAAGQVSHADGRSTFIPDPVAVP